MDNQLNMNRQLHELARSSSASFQLLARSKPGATGDLPILERLAPGIKAEGARTRAGEFTAMDHVTRLAAGKGPGAAEFVEHGDRFFANCPGRKAVERHHRPTDGLSFSIASCRPRCRERCRLAYRWPSV